MLFALVASALAPYLQADRLRLGILLAYPPRLAGAAVAIALTVVAASRRDRGTAFVTAVSAMLFVASAGWGGGPGAQGPVPAEALTLFTYNVHNRADAAGFAAAAARHEGIDVISLQEVRPPNRKFFVAALPEFEFFWADPAKLPERRSTGVFASMIGLRRERFEHLDDVEVLTGITGYRTFAVRTVLDGESLWIVNVHATKPFWLEDGLFEFIADAPAKAQWHQNEGEQLSRWTAAHEEFPMILAGDFNAPGYARVMHLEGLSSAHAVVGRGPHLTFPSVLPIWGIDHVLGNDRIRFFESRALAAGPSDHLAQLARFSVASDRPVPADQVGEVFEELSFER